MVDDAMPAARASDAERESAALALREHLVAGRLTLEEFTARLDRVYGSATRGDLEAVAADLPAAAAPAQGRVRRWIVAIFGGAERRGRWRLGDDTRVVAVMGGCELDLRSAVLEAPEATITCVAVMGGIEVVVPEGIDVEVSGFAFMGGNGSHVAEPRPGAPRIHVRAFALMGGVDVRSKPARRRG